VPYDTANIFRQAKAEVIETFGNTFIVYDKNENLLPHEFTGLIETKFYKEYIRRLAKTQADVWYLQPDYFIANKQTPSKKMRVWDFEDQFIQNQKVCTLIYLTSVNDPVTRIIRSL
jgi:hypothetical protein